MTVIRFGDRKVENELCDEEPRNILAQKVVFDALIKKYPDFRDTFEYSGTRGKLEKNLEDLEDGKPTNKRRCIQLECGWWISAYGRWNKALSLIEHACRHAASLAPRS